VLGGVCISAAIHPAGKRVFAALSVSTPVLRMTPIREQEVRQAVLEAAGRVAQAESAQS
jgi:DNA-binding IclR family transcriptional regulator